GAPEAVLKHCSSVVADGAERPITDLDRQYFNFENHRLAAKGLRVLCVARKGIADSEQQISPELEGELTVLGLIAISDPPKESAKEAIGICQKAGIKVVMLTGDQLSTAKAIASKLGIISGSAADNQAINAPELEHLQDHEVREL